MQEPIDRSGVRSSEGEGDDALRDAVERVRNGDAAAFEVVARRCAPRLFRLASRLERRREDAEDLVQETLVRALPALTRFEGRASIDTYLTRSMTNLWKNRLRSRARRRVVPEGDLPARDEAPPRVELRADDRPGPEAALVDRAARRSLADRVRVALERLSPERRLVLLLRELDGRSYEAIAGLVDAPIGTVRSRLARARDDLRRALGGAR